MSFNSPIEFLKVIIHNRVVYARGLSNNRIVYTHDRDIANSNGMSRVIPLPLCSKESYISLIQSYIRGNYQDNRIRLINDSILPLSEELAFHRRLDPVDFYPRQKYNTFYSNHILSDDDIILLLKDYNRVLLSTPSVLTRDTSILGLDAEESLWLYPL